MLTEMSRRRILTLRGLQKVGDKQIVFLIEVIQSERWTARLGRQILNQQESVTGRRTMSFIIIQAGKAFCGNFVSLTLRRLVMSIKTEALRAPGSASLQQRRNNQARTRSADCRSIGVCLVSLCQSSAKRK